MTEANLDQEELCATTLSAIIASRQPLTDENYSSFVHQILSGLKWLHSANVLHRDIKPVRLSLGNLAI